MTTEERNIIKSLCTAVQRCNEEQRMYLLGFAEAIAMMAGGKEKENANATA